MSKSITGGNVAAELLNQNKPKEEERETRNRRVQCIFTPSLYERLNDTAWKQKQSVNETIIKAIEQYLERSK